MAVASSRPGCAMRRCLSLPLCGAALASKDRRCGRYSAARGKRSDMAVEAVSRRTYVATPRRGPITRLLEDERWLASVLLLPTIVLLGLFIAYPFVMGVLLAVTDTKVGVSGGFVGFANFVKLWHDDIFRVAVYNTFLSTLFMTIFY